MPSPEPGPALTSRIIGLAIKVHRKLGPGLLESVYNACLCWELQNANLAFQREVPLPVIYEDIRLPQAYFADIIVAQTVLLELKTVEHILPVHEAQTLTYLHLSGCQVGLLMNFNSAMLKDGLRRYIPDGRRVIPQISA
jgi:GxxExxY protein